MSSPKAAPGVVVTIEELRCAGCGVLLGRKTGNGVDVARGHMRARFEAMPLVVHFDCYKCRRKTCFQFGKALTDDKN